MDVNLRKVGEVEMDRKKVIKALEERISTCSMIGDGFDVVLNWKLADDILALLKEQELPTELKQKMWNALYAEEDEYEKKFVGKEEHLNWFTVYRPWLQKGFDIAINTIAEWEGR